MGVVYLAHDTKLDRKVALKFLPAELADDADRIRRLVQEAKAASAPRHPNILSVYELEQFENQHFIVCEYIEGETLRQRLERGRLTLDETLEIAVQAAAGLEAAHKRGIVHRDVKPENIMLCENPLVKVVDFGLARLILEDHTEISTVESHSVLSKSSELTTLDLHSVPGKIPSGTLPYMSPEQLGGKEVDARSDVWSLGVCLYEMLVRQRPFWGETLKELSDAIKNRAFPRLPEDTPADLCHAVRRALKKSPDERYQTMRDFLLELRELKHDLDLAKDIERSTPPSPPEPTVAVKTVHQHRALMVGLMVFLVAAAAVGWALWHRHRVAQARQHYAEGRKFLKQRDRTGTLSAKKQFELAVTKDPNYALAYVGLADAYVLMEEYVGSPSKETLPLAEENANKAIKLNGRLGEAYASLGFIKTKQWNWVGAKQAFEQAINLDPNYPTTRHWYNLYLRIVGQYDEALKQINSASELNPDSEIIRVNIIITNLIMGDLKAAEKAGDDLLSLNSRHWGGRSWRGLVYLEQKRPEKAVLDLNQGVDRSQKSHTLLANLGYGYAVTGRIPEAQNVIRELVSLKDDNKATGQDLAKIYAGLNEKDEAFVLLEEDFKKGSGDLPNISWHPAFKSLKSDPRYYSLLSRMGLIADRRLLWQPSQR